MKCVKLLTALFVCLILAACAPDPRNQADARAIEASAQQDTADREQARQQRQVEFDLQQEQERATSRQWVVALGEFISWGMRALTVTVVIVLLSAGVGVSWGMVGSGMAVSQAAQMRARLISLNPETRQYPLYLHHLGRGRFSLVDMNTGLVRMLDVRNAPDRQLIATAGAVRLSGAVAAEARKAKDSDSAGVAIVGTHPVVVGALDGSLQVGEEINHG